MSYQVAHLDELDRLPADDEGLIWQPVRRRFGIEAFGVNAWSGEKAGDRVIEEHRERDGAEELYFVAAGRATFTLGEEEVDAPTGTFVFVQPGTLRGAIAREPGTMVLAIGAKRGEVFEPSGWEWTAVAGAYQRQGRHDDARAAMREGIDRYPAAWQGYYNLACIEALAGEREAALDALARAADLDREEVARYAAAEADLDPLRDEPRFPR